MFTNLFNRATEIKKSADFSQRKLYDSSWAGRLRTSVQYQKNYIDPLTAKDNLSVEDLEYLESQSWNCPCCGEKFDSRNASQICHVNPKGHLTIKNIWLGCKSCNIAQRDFTFNPFEFFKKNGIYFLDYFASDPDKIGKKLKMDEKTIQRFKNRLARIGR